MDSFNVKDIELPFKIIQKNLDEYNQKILKLSEVSDQEKKELLEKAKPIGFN